MKNMFRGLLLVSGGMVAGALISASLAGPAKQGASILPLDEIRQFTDVYGAVKQFYVEPVEDKRKRFPACCPDLIRIRLS